ncbi:MAG: MBL fold metallo-hydrolase [Verrucomicrobia bacterium]|jgi:7,8-dihydropterin-6-yl-methyl-4-(beta-D-ribofuranosyl)aminobenzene 5'-phosphate synthase|nr:MBL fold metallo-hydrolase [Verrucomicrobiota bacterium]OQC65493.1 MAG: ribonuclease Z [Verrucomicrobia bacterium ADurb.Bin006]MDI9381884.1 MBL fold metallo-hydrolase [Verrucomicrobiota bacterium]NMD20486.1 MBL fold metallo-hydrolase [Verrucomicrobiota bacterium]HNU98490.1 MBL fold metallo-hydrolase [Verrucomicrobiota bacterium]
MNNTIAVTVLVENTARDRGLMGEHGLAYYVQAGGRTLLFDTGQTSLIIQNARRLGIELSGLDAVALSHGHYDHTGGLHAVLGIARDAELYTHPAACARRFARNPDGTTRDVGIGRESLDSIQARPERIHETTTATEVAQGVFLTGEIPRATDFEDVGGPFVLDRRGLEADPIVDDQALFFDTADGVAVLLGCAHAGIVNTLRHIRQLTGGRPIHSVLGGMHLLAAGPERMNRTVEALRGEKVRRLGPAHCTGMAATSRLWHEFPQACTVCAVGSRFTFER